MKGVRMDGGRGAHTTMVGLKLIPGMDTRTVSPCWREDPVLSAGGVMLWKWVVCHWGHLGKSRNWGG